MSGQVAPMGTIQAAMAISRAGTAEFTAMVAENKASQAFADNMVLTADNLNADAKQLYVVESVQPALQLIAIGVGVVAAAVAIVATGGAALGLLPETAVGAGVANYGNAIASGSSLFTGVAEGFQSYGQGLEGMMTEGQTAVTTLTKATSTLGELIKDQSEGASSVGKAAAQWIQSAGVIETQRVLK